jgi:2-dehydro-3-deoxyphosphooctonate aldolase (KDO 8-P synthase)
MIFILGPCVIESRQHCLKMAKEIKSIVDSFGIKDWYFKASYDKANRTSLDGFRGIGEQEGFSTLIEVKERLGVNTTTDVHSVEEAFGFGGIVDLLQIPALLSRQTDILVAAGQAANRVNIKKGPFSAPWDLPHAVRKVEAGGCKTVYVTERGTCFGYNRLVVDFLSIPILKDLGIPVFFDCTHSLQLPQAGSGCSASMPRDYAMILARAATAAGADGLFAEVHDDPDHAKCDGPNSLDLKKLPEFIENILKLKV